MGTLQTSSNFIFMVMYVLSQSRINNGFVSSQNRGGRGRWKEIATVVVESALFCRRRKNESKIPLLLANLISQSAPRKIYYLLPTKKHGSLRIHGLFQRPGAKFNYKFLHKIGSLWNAIVLSIAICPRFRFGPPARNFLSPPLYGPNKPIYIRFSLLHRYTCLCCDVMRWNCKFWLTREIFLCLFLFWCENTSRRYYSAQWIGQRRVYSERNVCHQLSITHQ